MWPRRRFLRACAGLTAAGAALTADAFYVEPGWLEVSRVHVPFPARLRILHLSDLHASAVIPPVQIERAIELSLAERPDLIAVTGDFITNVHDFDPRAYAALLARLARAAPAYAVLGNHDGGRWAARASGFTDTSVVRSILHEAGVTLLHNACVTVDRHRARFTLAGVGDLWAGEVRAADAFRAADPALPSILLAHNPDSKDLVADEHWNVMLSGHTHGGQFRDPLTGARPFVPVEDPRYVSGLGMWRGRAIHVSNGVGNVMGVRFNCRPQVSVLELG